MSTIQLTIDDRQITVPRGTTVYQAAKQLGLDVPIFCYHDRMPPLGACRVCLVQVEGSQKLQTSCTLEATEGMVIRTQAASAVEGRKAILELLLINHPLDCPICDRGGECPLQDQALAHGPGESRFFEEKRHFTKAKPLGPVLMLDRERCIACARCTRFGELVAADHALTFIDRGYKTEVGTVDGAPVKSKFIGNTIMICPVGALTSQVYRFRARPWDNQPTKSSCTLCPIGCSTQLDRRNGELVRIRSSENRAINDVWLCDKGWFGYEFASHPARLTTPLIRRAGVLEPATLEEALDLVVARMVGAKRGGKIAAFGGNPLTVEENYLCQKLFREGLGTNHIDHRVGQPLFGIYEEGISAGMELSLGECETLAYGWILGLDITEEFPLLWLRLHQAMQKGAQVEFIGHFSPEVAAQLAATTVHRPGEELERVQEALKRWTPFAESGKKAAFFIGNQYLSTDSRLAILALLSQFQKQFPHITLNLLEGRGNGVGARFAGMRPDLGPAGAAITASGKNFEQWLKATLEDGWDLLYVVGANPAEKVAASLWKKARERVQFLVVQDLFLTKTAQEADLVLPSLCAFEKEGSFITIDRHKQKIAPGKELPSGLLSDGEIFMRIGKKLGLSLVVDPAFTTRLSTERVLLMRSRGLQEVKPLVTPSNHDQLFATFSQPLFDKGVRMRHNPHLSQLSPRVAVRMHPEEAVSRGLQEGDVLVCIGAYTQKALLQLDSGVALRTVVVPRSLGWTMERNGVPLSLTKAEA